MRRVARACMVALLEQYVVDNALSLIGQKQSIACMVKLWRLDAQTSAFGMIHALLADLFPERVPQRYQRRA